MTGQRERIAAFRALHRPGDPLLLPNPWDAGSAKLLASLGFQALATTSSGFAATLGRRDGSVSRAEAVAHAAQIVAATELPVSADLENGYGDAPEEVAETAREAAATGLAGFSIEDFSGTEIYDARLAAERVRAAVQAAHAADPPLVVTARAENHIRGRDDLADTIARLQAYQEAGADVLYAPGPTRAEDLRAIVAAVDRPVNVLARAGCPPVAELAALGVSRISVGGAFAFAALQRLAAAARELREAGTYGFTGPAAEGGRLARDAFADQPPRP